MRNLKFLLILLFVFSFAPINSYAASIQTNTNYQAVVLGEIIKKKVKKSSNLYYTEYKLKTKKWLYKNSGLKQSKHLTIRTLGAELPEKGLVIKASTSPDFIPIKKDAIFLLEDTKRKQKGIYTLSKNGILHKDNISSLQIE